SRRKPGPSFQAAKRRSRRLKHLRKFCSVAGSSGWIPAFAGTTILEMSARKAARIAVRLAAVISRRSGPADADQQGVAGSTLSARRDLGRQGPQFRAVLGA